MMQNNLLKFTFAEPDPKIILPYALTWIEWSDGYMLNIYMSIDKPFVIIDSIFIINPLRHGNEIYGLPSEAYFIHKN